MLDLLFLIILTTIMPNAIHSPIVSIIVAIRITIRPRAPTLRGVEQTQLRAFLGRVGALVRHLLPPTTSEGIVLRSNGVRVGTVITCADLLGVEVGLVAYGCTAANTFELIAQTVVEHSSRAKTKRTLTFLEGNFR